MSIFTKNGDNELKIALAIRQVKLSINFASLELLL